MNQKATANRFQNFFKADAYLQLKNYLYNYLLRKRAIGSRLAETCSGWVLEIGTGISPVSSPGTGTIFTEISADGLLALKKTLGTGNYIVADGTALPFRTGTISCCVSSEVIEHIHDDLLALQEMSRVLAPGGRCVITFPHRTAYFSIDDSFVHHYRRYNLGDICNKLQAAGLTPCYIAKILGPLEKTTMLCIILFIKATGGKQNRLSSSRRLLLSGMYLPIFKWVNRVFAMLAWLDAKITPRSMSTVLLIECEKQDTL